jgi:hypothetical protein
MRKSILILGIACLIAWTLPQICSAEIDPETAVGVWLFDEGAGKTTKDACGSWEPRASAHVPDEKKWIHFAATYDSNAKNEHLVVYVNGERAGVSTRPGDIAVTGNAVEIGRWGGGSYFVGIIDEAAIFNTVLSEDDLTTIVEHGLGKALGGLGVEPTNKLAVTWGAIKANR